MTPLVEHHAPVWTPFGEWMSTPARRRELALFLAGLAEVKGMGDTIANGLAELAGGLSPKQRWLLFKLLVNALRDGDDVRLNAAVADLCEVAR